MLVVGASLAVTGCSSGGQAQTAPRIGRRRLRFRETGGSAHPLSQVLQNDVETSAHIERIGTIWTEQGSPLRAIPFLAKVVELEPENLEMRTDLAKAFCRYGSLAAPGSRRRRF